MMEVRDHPMVAEGVARASPGGPLGQDTPLDCGAEACQRPSEQEVYEEEYVLSRQELRVAVVQP